MKTLMIRGDRLLCALRWFDFVRDRLYTSMPVDLNPVGFAEGPRLIQLLGRWNLIGFLTHSRTTFVREMLMKTLESPGNRRLLSEEIDIAPVLEGLEQHRSCEPGLRFLRQFASGEVSDADLMPGA